MRKSNHKKSNKQNQKRKRKTRTDSKQELNENCETESRNVITRENRNTKDELL